MWCRTLGTISCAALIECGGGCAMLGAARPDLGVITHGASRATVEAEFGPAASQRISDEGMTVATYEYDGGWGWEALAAIAQIVLAVEGGGVAGLAAAPLSLLDDPLDEERQVIEVTYDAEQRVVTSGRAGPGAAARN